MKYLFFGLGPWYGQNIDNVLRSQKDKFQNAVLQIVQTSTTIKVIMTSRETALHIEHYSWYKVHELSSKAAISLLDRKLPKMHKLWRYSFILNFELDNTI